MTSLKKIETILKVEKESGVIKNIFKKMSYILITFISGYGLIQLQKIQDNIVGMMAMGVILHFYFVIINMIGLVFILSIYHLSKQYSNLLEIKSQAINKANLLNEKIEEDVIAISGMVNLLRRG